MEKSKGEGQSQGHNKCARVRTSNPMIFCTRKRNKYILETLHSSLGRKNLKNPNPAKSKDRKTMMMNMTSEAPRWKETSNLGRVRAIN